MILPIVRYGDPVLTTPASAVGEFDDSLRDLASEMFETMYAAPGVGLAAPQIGKNIRLVVIDITSGREAGSQIVIANPALVEMRGEASREEGCLSLPGLSAAVRRPSWVLVRGQNLEGRVFEVEADGQLARCFCHEIDHINGILYIDRVSPLKRDFLKKKIRKRIREGSW